MGKSSGENSNTHTHFYTHIQTHLYTHIPSIPLNQAASLASTLQLLPPLFACLVLHSSSLPHTHTHTHRVPSKKKWLPHALLHRTPSALGHTTPLACRALKSINSFWSCTNRDSLRFLSLFLPLTLPLSLSTYFYFLCAYFALFTASLRPLPPSPWLTFLWHKSF